MVRVSVLGVELSQLVGALGSEAVPMFAAMHITVKLSRESYTRPQVSLPECLQRHLHRPPKANCASNSTSDACEIPCSKKCPRLDSAQDFSSVEFPCLDDYALSDCPRHKVSLTTTFKPDEVPSANHFSVPLVLALRCRRVKCYRD